MIDTASVPTGKLQGIEREWDFQSGWVRAPLREIVFNDRLSKQARLVWLWLASVPPGSANVSWGECETLLRCGTKARRSCIGQLVTEGYISVLDSGFVVMHDPYEVFDNKRQEVLESLREEWNESVDLIIESEKSTNQRTLILAEKKIDKEIEKIEAQLVEPEIELPEEKPVKPLKYDAGEDILEAWNQCKPESYSSMRRLSSKQKECVKKHMNNIGLKPSDTKDFVCAVCKGLDKSPFWSKQVNAHGRNFNAVFGYGSPQDTKMKNVENLYSLGNEEIAVQQEPARKEYSNDQQELIDRYRYIKLNYENVRLREEDKEAERWYKHLQETIEELNEMGVEIDGI